MSLSGFAGLDPIVGVPDGGVVSTVHVVVVDVPVLPAASTSRTLNVCVPSASVAVVYGEVHAVHAPVSSWHW